MEVPQLCMEWASVVHGMGPECLSCAMEWVPSASVVHGMGPECHGWCFAEVLFIEREDDTCGQLLVNSPCFWQTLLGYWDQRSVCTYVHNIVQGLGGLWVWPVVGVVFS